MKAATEAVYLPLLFLTVALLGGLRVDDRADIRAAAAVRARAGDDAVRRARAGPCARAGAADERRRGRRWRISTASS